MDDANVTFPNPSGCNTLDIYGKVINGNIIDDKDNIVFIKKLIFIDFFITALPWGKAEHNKVLKYGRFVP